jgi:hypothetical protein
VVRLCGRAARKLDDTQLLDVLYAARENRALVCVHAENHAMIYWTGKRLIANGHRLIVRPFGTEPVIRVTGEGDDASLVEEVVDGVVVVLTEVAAAWLPPFTQPVVPAASQAAATQKAGYTATHIRASVLTGRIYDDRGIRRDHHRHFGFLRFTATGCQSCRIGIGNA